MEVVGGGIYDKLPHVISSKYGVLSIDVTQKSTAKSTSSRNKSILLNKPSSSSSSSSAGGSSSSNNNQLTDIFNDFLSENRISFSFNNKSIDVESLSQNVILLSLSILDDKDSGILSLPFPFFPSFSPPPFLPSALPLPFFPPDSPSFSRSSFLPSFLVPSFLLFSFLLSYFSCPPERKDRGNSFINSYYYAIFPFPRRKIFYLISPFFSFFIVQINHLFYVSIICPILSYSILLSITFPIKG